MLSLGGHKPAALFKPQIGFLPLNAAGIAISYAAHTLTGCPADVQNLVHRVAVCFVELNLQRAQFAVGLKPDDHRYIALFPFFHLLTAHYMTQLIYTVLQVRQQVKIG